MFSPMDIIAGGSLGLGILGGFLSSQPRLSKADFDYDPARTALNRYKELTNINSDYWKQLKGMLSTEVSKATPTLDTLFGFNKAAGISDTGATAIASMQSAEGALRNRESIGQMLTKSFFNTENLAQGYLQQEAERGKAQVLGYGEYFGGVQKEQNSFFDQLASFGGGYLSKKYLPQTIKGGIYG